MEPHVGSRMRRKLRRSAVSIRRQQVLNAPSVEALEERLCLSSVPIVSITATDSNASEVGLDPGQFVVSRTGPTDQPLTVKLYYSGTADPVRPIQLPPDQYWDYDTVPRSILDNNQITIPAGQSSVAIVIKPLKDQTAEGAGYLEFQIGEDPAYEGGGGAAGIELADGAGHFMVNVSAPDPVASEVGD